MSPVIHKSLSKKSAVAARRGVARVHLVACFMLLAGSLDAQVVEPRTPIEELDIGARVHLQFNTTSSDAAPSSEFLLRRARVWIEGRVNDWIDGVAQVDFGRGKTTARYAFVRMHLSPGLHVSFGQFKRAFDLFELTSSSRILVIERAGAIAGVDGCAGVGGICSYSRFSEGLGLSSLDIGVLVNGDLDDGKASYSVSVTNGTGGNKREDNGTKSLSGRLEVQIDPRVGLGANAVLKDFSNPLTGDAEFAPAVGVDVEVGDFDGGFHAQFGVLAGDNWKKLGADFDPARFATAQAILSYKRPVAGEGRIRFVEPLARVSWGDPDTDVDDDGGLLFTPGVAIHFEGRNKMAANVDVWSPQEGQTFWSLKVQTYLYF